MSNGTSDVERYARDLAAAAYPEAEDLGGLLGFRRKWVLRLATALPADGTLQDLVASFVASARHEIAKSLNIAADSFDSPLPSASGIRLDSHHLILEIDCPTAPESGDSVAIATSVILRAADEQWQLEDLQGLPKRYWFILG